MELERLESQLDTAELTQLAAPAPVHDCCLESGTSARVKPGRLCGGDRFFMVRCARPGRERVRAQMPFAAFAALRRQLGPQAALLIKSPFPAAPSKARALASRFFSAAQFDAARADSDRARALDAWLGEVVQLAIWGTLSHKACWAVRDALLYDEAERVVEAAALPAKDASPASKQVSPAPATPVTPPLLPSPPLSPPREPSPPPSISGKPPIPPFEDKELDFDECGPGGREDCASQQSDPGPCAIARALQSLQSSVEMETRRMVMV
jgi:hypothetical protein